MAGMNWLPRHLLKYLCLLPIIYLVVLYTMGAQGIRLAAYLDSVAERFPEVLSNPYFLMAAIIMLVVACVRGMTLVWNILYCCATTLWILEIILLSDAGSIILPSAIWAIPGAESLLSVPTDYPVSIFLIPLLWILGGLCTNAFRSITVACCLNFIISLLLAYACQGIAYLWENMQEPFFPDLLAQFKTVRWCTAILPALFMFLYTFFLAVFEALIPRRLIEKPLNKSQEKETAEA